jgi:MFS family permease
MIQPTLQRERFSRMPALRSRGFQLFWYGQMISLTGTWVQSIAQQWLVLNLTHSPFKVGLIVTVQFLPLLVLVLFTGPVADRVDRRILLICTQVIAMMLATILGTLTLLHLIRFWEILILASALGTVNAFYVPARQSFVPELVDRSAILNAVALNSAVFNGARVIGPAIGGLLYAITGPAWAFYINAASYLAVIAGLLLIRPSHRARSERAKREPGTFLTDLLEGFRYIFATTPILVILLMIGIASLFALNFTTLLPPFAKYVLHLGSGGFGALLAVQGAGSLLASVVLSIYSRPDLARRLIYGGAFSFLILEVAFSFTRSFTISACILLPTGFAMSIFSTTANSRVLNLSPERLHGRVMSAYSLMFLGVTPIGSLLAGVVAETLGAQYGFLLGASITLICVTVIYLLRLNSRPVVDPVAAGND